MLMYSVEHPPVYEAKVTNSFLYSKKENFKADFEKYLAIFEDIPEVEKTCIQRIFRSSSNRLVFKDKFKESTWVLFDKLNSLGLELISNDYLFTEDLETNFLIKHNNLNLRYSCGIQLNLGLGLITDRMSFFEVSYSIQSRFERKKQVYCKNEIEGAKKPLLFDNDYDRDIELTLKSIEAHLEF